MGLIGYTVVPAQPGSGETHATFGPDDEVPEWAAAHMGVHLFEGGEHPYPESDYPGKPATKDDLEGGKHEAPTEREFGVEPPRSGAGSGKDAWFAFAGEKGFPVEPTAKRDEIVDALIAAKVIEDHKQ